MTTWVVGRGLIGAAVARRLGPDRCWSPSAQITWDDEAVRDARIHAAATEFLDAVGDGPWAVVWCAGAGVAGTSEAGLLAEARAVRVLLDGLTIDGRSGGTMFLASSSAVYAGSVGSPFHEGSPVAPLSPYGFTKLDQEQAATAWAGNSTQLASAASSSSGASRTGPVLRQILKFSSLRCVSIR
jgi:UDP-glucose 4-epimerase